MLTIVNLFPKDISFLVYLLKLMFEIDDIVRLRKQLGLTQTELAKLSGVSQSLITKMEAKKVEPAYSKVKILIETLQKKKRSDKRTAKNICSKTLKGLDK